MPATRPDPLAQRRWTAREVRQLIADNPLVTPRYELVDGELLVTPSPGWWHQSAVDILWRALDAYLTRELPGRVRTSPMDVELEAESLLQPDLFVVPMPEVSRIKNAGTPVRELLLAIEVLSPSSARHDRVKKRLVYLRHVAEYWIVDLDSRVVERWRAMDERPEMLLTSLEWQPAGAAEAFRLDLAGFFAEVFDEG